MQREWAADNSRKASAAKGDIVVFKAPCDVDPPPPMASQSAPPAKKAGA
jgi:hypothetical protein